MNWIVDEDHRRWLFDFNWWFHEGDKSKIILSLREGVPLSPKNSKFLAAILGGSVKPLTGKAKRGFNRFRENIKSPQNSRILKNQGKTRKEMLSSFGKNEIITGEPQSKKPNGYAESAHCTAKIKKPDDSYVQRHGELTEKFIALYDSVTAEK